MGNRHTSRGISLLEVIIAFAITSVLVAATMPNYHDYTVRARVNEALSLASPAQDALVRTCKKDEKALVTSNQDAGSVYAAPALDQDFIDRVDTLAALGQNVLISNFRRFHRLSVYLARYTQRPLGITMGASKLKETFDASRLWISAYTNDVPCYIPSERVLREGGYEGGGAMTFHDWASPFLPGLEKKIVDEVHYQLGKTYRRPHPHLLERNP